MMLSVIIPVYNNEKQIERCLSSLVEQDYRSFEIIIIDDGSTDKSVEIADNFLSKHGIEYTLKKQDNQGPSSARNAGLAISKGKYYTFIDADDYILQGMFSDMMQIIEDSNADIIECDFVNNARSNPYKEELKIINGRERCMYYFLKSICIKPVVCGAIYKKEKLEKIRFDQDIHLGEDTCYKIKCLLRDIKIVSIKKAYYVNVIEADNSLSRKKMGDKDIYSIVKYLDFAEKIIKEYITQSSVLYDYLYKIGVSYYARIVREGIVSDDNCELMDLKKHIKRFKTHTSNEVVVYRVEEFLLIHNKKFFRFVYEIIKG